MHPTLLPGVHFGVGWGALWRRRGAFPEGGVHCKKLLTINRFRVITTPKQEFGGFMDKKQTTSETVYRLSVVVLDTLLSKQAISSEEYDCLRCHLAEDAGAPIGLLESENMLWKKEL